MGEQRRRRFFTKPVPSLLLYNFLTDRQLGEKKKKERTSIQLEKK
jgi:hypothetical protein